jgi:hypothetical protein
MGSWNAYPAKVPTDPVVDNFIAERVAKVHLCLNSLCQRSVVVAFWLAVLFAVCYRYRR